MAGYVQIHVKIKIDTEINGGFSKSASVASETLTAIRMASSLTIKGTIAERYNAGLHSAISELKRPLFTMIFFSLTQSAEFFFLALGFSLSIHHQLPWSHY